MVTYTVKERIILALMDGAVFLGMGRTYLWLGSKLFALKVEDTKT